jgi:WD40 repeat protein
MIGGASDGSIHIWNVKRQYQRADIIIQTAHSSESSVLSICPSPTLSNVYVSRASDGIVHVWDIKASQSAPIGTFEGLHSIYPTSNVAMRYDICYWYQSCNNITAILI